MTDVQDRYRQVSKGFDAAVRAMTPDKWEAQSPCERWKARDVVGHVVAGHRGVIAAVRGGESKPLGTAEDPKEAWQEASRAIDEITGDSDTLATEISRRRRCQREISAVSSYDGQLLLPHADGRRLESACQKAPGLPEELSAPSKQ